ncbi:MAG: dihydropteroate synthase [Helicobacteraceae bacterium]|nr:dihydropteroate synthase [Helicobacteraceae bacterium]
MLVQRLSTLLDFKKYLKELGVDSGGVAILKKKATSNLFYIKDMHVGAANILKQDALSIGADLAVPKGVVTAEKKRVDAILIATTAQLEKLVQKELAQPFGLKDLSAQLKLHLNKATKATKATKIMGVINANDDSFYSASRFNTESAIVKIEQMIEDGADIIDVGAVSSKPNSVGVSELEELERIKPIVDLIKQKKLYEKVAFSVDTYTPLVARYACENGFSIINDIKGFESDELCKVASEFNAQAILMHMQGEPRNMQDNPKYDSILTDISNFFQERIEKLNSFGVENIVLDVGIGFGKTLEHNLELIANLEHFKMFHKELLVGASRKSMIAKIVPSKSEERLSGTLAIHLKAIDNGASIIRVHDVKEHYQAIRVNEAIKSV